MSRDEFLKKIDTRNFKHEEEIDGVRVIHTGLIMNVHRGYKASLIGGEYKDLGYEQQECIEMYDFNGNRFYSNCSSKEEAEKISDKMQKIMLTMHVRAGENGKIFGGVSSKEIAEELQKTYKINVDKKKIDLKETIKELGMRTVEIRLYEGVIAKLKVNVVSGK